MSTDLLHSVTHQLTEADDGYWVGEVAGAISYPEGRSQACSDAEAGENTGWFDHRADVLAMTLKSFPPGGTMLDVGGGNGFLTRALQAAGHDVALLEPDSAAVARARASGVSPVVHATLREAGFEPDTLPAVGLFDVLEHLHDPRDHLRHIRSLLIPGGRIYLTVPAHRWLWSAHDDQAGHLRRYSQRRLRRSLTDAGFGVEYLSAFFGPLPLAVLLRRSIPTVWGRRRLATEPMHGYPQDSGSPLQRALDWRYRAELARLERGPKRFGASLLAVAVAPAAPPAAPTQ